MFDQSAPPPRTGIAGVPTLSGGLPLLGQLPSMIRDLPAHYERAIAEHGRIFWFDAGLGIRQLAIADPSVIELLKAREASVSFYGEAASTLIGGSLLTFDGEPHRRLRGAMAPPFTPKQVHRSDVMRIVGEVARKHVDAWLRAGSIEVLRSTQALALEVIVRLIGIRSDDLEVWRRQYQRYLLGSIPTRFPTPLHWWARRARDWIDRGLREVVVDLRRRGERDTLVGSIAHACDEAGELLTLDQVVPNLRVLVLAGHETTASSMAWAMLHQARSPASQARARDEVAQVADLEALTNDGERFTWAERQFREALRLYPPVASMVRKLAGPLTIAGVEVPTGTLVAIPITTLLRDPERWREPDRFEPERFDTRPRATTIDTLMFGGGPHFCLGYHIAMAEGTLVMLTLARALADAGLKMVPVREQPLVPVWVPLTHPPGKAAVRFVPA